MADHTAIEWADSTFNPWMGCTKISPACDHCYAERDTARFGRVGWGPGAARVRTSAANWRKPVHWNTRADVFRECAGCGWRGDIAVRAEPVAFACPACDVVNWRPARRRVFCASLADVFDNEVDPQWRDDLFDLIAATPNLDWLLLTKRIGNVTKLLTDLRDSEPNDRRWGELNAWLHHGRPPANVWLGATICNQAEAVRDIPKLLAIPAAVRFLSIEPMLGPVDIAWAFPDTRTGCCHRCGFRTNRVGGICPNDGETLRGDIGLDWVIAGGESGPHARPMHPDWVRSLRDQCAAAGVPFLFKQFGEWAPTTVPADPWPPAADPKLVLVEGEWQGQAKRSFYMRRVGKKAAGNTLDGRQHLEWPAP